MHFIRAFRFGEKLGLYLIRETFVFSICIKLKRFIGDVTFTDDFN